MASVIYIEAEDVESAWLEALKRVLKEGDHISTTYFLKYWFFNRRSLAPLI